MTNERAVLLASDEIIDFCDSISGYGSRPEFPFVAVKAQYDSYSDEVWEIRDQTNVLISSYWALNGGEKKATAIVKAFNEMESSLRKIYETFHE